MCVCVCVRERERESVCACVRACMCERAHYISCCWLVVVTELLPFCAFFVCFVCLVVVFLRNPRVYNYCIVGPRFQFRKSASPARDWE